MFVVVVSLTVGTPVHAERAVCELDLGRAVLEVPLLLRLVVAGLAVTAEHIRPGATLANNPSGATYTIVVLPVVRALGTMTNLVFTFEVMYTVR